MPPKFQSSFIPKGPMGSVSSGPAASRIKKPRSILSLVAIGVFSLSMLAAVAAFGYKFYLNYSIRATAAELETQRARIDEEAVEEIRRLNNRLKAANELINRHVVLTPFFRFLESSTLRSVAFNELSYDTDLDGVNLTLRGYATSYAALALQAEAFKQMGELKNQTFSDLSLDESGNVVFSFRTTVDPNLLSYRREVESLTPTASPVAPTSTSTATTTLPLTATTTQASTSSPQTTSN